LIDRLRQELGPFYLLPEGDTGRPRCWVSVPAVGKAEQDAELAGGARLAGITWAGSDQHPLPDARVSLIDRSGTVVAVARTDTDRQYAGHRSGGFSSTYRVQNRSRSVP